MKRIGTIFAKNLKENRKKCGFTQAQLAEKVNVSTHHIGMLELMRNYPTFDLIERIALAFNIEIYELFTDTYSPQKELQQLKKDKMEELKELITKTIKESINQNCKYSRK